MGKKKEQEMTKDNNKTGRKKGGRTSKGTCLSCFGSNAVDSNDEDDETTQTNITENNKNPKVKHGGATEVNRDTGKKKGKQREKRTKEEITRGTTQIQVINRDTAETNTVTTEKNIETTEKNIETTEKNIETTEKNIETTQDSTAIEATCGKTETTVEVVRIQVEPPPDYEEQKSERTTKQTEVDDSCKKLKDSEIHQEPPDEHEGKKRKNVPGSKQSPQSVKKQKDAVDSHTPSNEHEGTIGENALSQKELDQDNTKPGRRLKARHPVGLQNLGNTCFFNAVMQNMNQSLLLVEHLAEKDFPRHSLTKSMVDFYDLMMLSKHRSTVSPSDVLNNICQRSPRFAGGRQQDSHELLRHLLDGLRHEERKSKGDPNNRKTLTKVDEVFGGHFMTVYTCKDCKTPYHVCEPMLDMSLPIAYEDFENDEGSSLNEEDNETVGDNQKYRKAAKSLMTPLAIEQKQDAEDHHNAHVPKAEEKKQSKKEAKNGKRKSHSQRSASKQRRREGRSILDCLDAFTRTELIADEYLCMHCHETRVNEGATDYQMTSAKKRTLIYNPPALLTLHLKRFEQTPYGFVKCNDTISFHDMIDIGPYCSSWCMRNEENETSIWYSLYGLVCHSGSLDGGHYVAYVKMRETEDIRQFLQKKFLNRDELTVEELVKMMTKMQRSREPNQPEKWQPKPVKGTWYYITDSHVSKVPEEQVWRQQAYLLFYERRQGNHGNEKLICYQRNAGNEDTSF